MDFDKLVKSDQFLVQLRGTCSGDDNITKLTNLLVEAVQCGAARVWLDCRQLTQIDYRGLRVLLQFLPQFEARGTTLLLCGLQPAVQERLDASGLASLLTLLPAEAYNGPDAPKSQNSRLQ
jgi:anti-anti-sigma factor